LLTELAQPTSEIEEIRVQNHSRHLRSMHAEWSWKIKKCDQRGLLSWKSSSMNGMDCGAEVAFVSPEVENISLFRHWGMTLNDLCVIEEQLARYDATTSYPALATERRLDGNVSHFSLFVVDHATGNQALIFHRSDCRVASEQDSRAVRRTVRS